MRILVEIVHPANVLVFLRPIRAFLARGDSVTVASRHKDVAGALLDGFGIAHRPISRQGRGLAGLGVELIRRDLALWRLVREVRPQAMLGFGGVAISHVGRLTGIPTLVVYDSENARLQIRLAWPFLTRLLVPADYDGPVPEGRTRRMAGTKDLSYFHPSAFRPDRERAVALGLDPARRNIFLRLVRWGANHDIGKTGWPPELAAALVARLSPLAKLHVSAEGDVPEALRPHLWQGPPGEVHHLLGQCDAYAGESCTMACEAVAMGVPALYAGVDFPGYTRGHARRGLLVLVPPEARATLPDAAAALLATPERFHAARAEWLATCPDWAEEIVAETDALVARSRR